MKRANIDMYDVEELAAHVCGVYQQYLEEQEDDEDGASRFVDNELIEQFGVNLESFCALLTYLLPMVAVSKSELTDKVYRGFATNVAVGERTYRQFILKEEVK